MTDFESILDQKKALGHLTALLEKRTIPHALLFTGIEGVGKRSAAIAFAMACNCAGSAHTPSPAEESENTPCTAPCNTCRSCKKILSNSHPDIIRVEPAGAYIRIAQIRELCSDLAMKPYEARLRVVVVADAQTMNPEAGNALLKALEEPPPRTILILTALQTSDLLPTIVSRCQHVRFNPISTQALADMLVAKQGLDPKEARITAAMANGSVTKALALKQDIWLNRRRWLIREINALASRSIGARLALAEKLAKDKDLLSDSLELMRQWLRDLIIYPYDPEKIINIDLAGQISQASTQCSAASLLDQIDAVQTAQKAIRANTNLRLALERMVFRMTNACEAAV